MGKLIVFLIKLWLLGLLAAPLVYAVIVFLAILPDLHVNWFD